MNLSDNGFDFIKSHEGLSLTAYQGAGEQYWTIGYGHYGPDVSPDAVLTVAEAEELLRFDLDYFVEQTNIIALTKFPDLTQNQFDALVSYCYNRGPGASNGSNGLQQLIQNSDTLAEVSDNFLIYWGTNQSAYNGLMNRRQAEKDLFDDGSIYEPESPTRKKRGYRFVLFHRQ